jgi:hypothetical protein
MVFTLSACCEAHHTPRYLWLIFPNPERFNPVWGPCENGMSVSQFVPSPATRHPNSCCMSLKIFSPGENIDRDLHLSSIDA